MTKPFKTPAGRLTEEGVREIKRRRANGDTYKTIAESIGVTLGTVYNVCSKRTWGWIS